MTDWQPIETAPKDGTRVDLWVTDRRVADSWWSLSHNGWIDPQGGWDGEYDRLEGEPSHWMPPPPPPGFLRVRDCDDPDNRTADFVVRSTPIPLPPVIGQGEIDTISRLWLHEDRAPALKSGDTFIAPYMARRKWWQIWKPRSWVEERVYRVRETAT